MKMIQHLVLFVGIVGAVLATPQWYNPAPQPGYGAYPSYGAHSAGAPLGADGRVVETPEVASARASHLAALAEASSRAAKGPSAATGYAPHDGAYNGIYNGPAQYGPRYHGPPAPLAADGRVVDTPEVAAEKARHFALFNAAAQHAPAAAPAPAYPTHGDYDSGAYNPAWDGPAYNNHY